MQFCCPQEGKGRLASPLPGLCLCRVHSHRVSVSPQGTLIQHLKEHILHGNMSSSDIILYYTTVSGLLRALGGGVLLSSVSRPSLALVPLGPV